MNITKTIEEELGQELERAGFQPDFSERDVWTYRRVKDGVGQSITVITGRYSRNALKVLFDTNVCGQGAREFRNFVPEEDIRHQEFWRYKSEEELRTILKEFKRLILAYGLKCLDTMSKPTTDAGLTEEMEWYLYRNHEKLYEEYSAKLQTQGKSAEEVIELIYQTMEQTLDEPFENVKDLLVGLAALYGHTVSWGGQAQWVMNENRSCWLKNVLGTMKSIPLLRSIIPEWDYMRKYRCRSSTGLLYDYKIILIFYYNEHPEEKKQK